ncbi:platelet-activating factor acetylhydrolase, isoform II-domain-containing protein [Podospora fimiseda]|uniref:Putative phospholipase n=1 Tax=Podospora fimiseda TaxID=252190 RepID=A0AAN6YNK2_9PEZI|nr:platelet-activating factor acetylhydrolase, isoform II-domain-containing protein [Podospora fimiseda]
MKGFPDTPKLLSQPTRRRPFYLRWRWLTVFLAAGYFLYCLLFSLSPFAHPLPKHTGPYAVGTIDIEAPVSPPRIIDPTLHFRGKKGDLPFELETVLFSVYYPTTYDQAKTCHHKRHTWIPNPLSLRAQGYAKAAHISNWFTDSIFTTAIRALVGSITIPAAVDVPLSSNITSHRIIIFSHGTVASRTDYSHYAGELASRGYVVVVLEHRDGSGPSSPIKRLGQPDKKRLLFDVSEVEREQDGLSPTVESFHQSQLNFRQAEIEEAVRIMKEISVGNSRQVFKQNPYHEGTQLAGWTGRLNTEGMVVAGHSYGATGAMQALKDGPTEARPFVGAIILDPGKQSGPLNTDINVPMLVVHSNSWSSKTSWFYGRAHFDTVKEIVEDNNKRGYLSWFMTSLGTSHPSITDAPLLEPYLLSFTTGATIDVYQGLRQYVHVAEDFLAFLQDGRIDRGLLAEKAEFPQYDEGSGLGMWKPGQGDNQQAWEEQGEWWDWRSYWQIHVSPLGNKEN